MIESYRARHELKLNAISIRRLGKIILLLNIVLSTVVAGLVFYIFLLKIGPGKTFEPVMLIIFFSWFLSMIPGAAIEYDCKKKSKELLDLVEE